MALPSFPMPWRSPLPEIRSSQDSLAKLLHRNREPWGCIGISFQMQTLTPTPPTLSSIPALLAKIQSRFPPWWTLTSVSARQAGMLTTVKHFPGHGDTNADPHLGVATVYRSRQEIDQVDLVRFRSAIASGVDAVMIAQVTVLPSSGRRQSCHHICGDYQRPTKAGSRIQRPGGNRCTEMGGLTRLYPQPALRPLDALQ